MRLRLAGAVLLLAAAYYVYLPLPSGVSEPWKLMLLDALFRSFMQAEIEARSCPAVHVTDTSLGGVPTRVFQPKGGKQLKRGVNISTVEDGRFAVEVSVKKSERYPKED
ncbi:hypothetical protein F7725_029010 [Dissostichus mawsoni]|uniref:Uncharacterized protein n=1 Tax=Dissostichus mawsoni TaxID=36200 RepID=A0A7J5XH87_DISMA|nr:hypothetical protein F7725_029010 [Dissostichus mawsoni]